ncbi:uncharacterized protein [Dysidea avara]|uniref:uncharacterized protein isoform X9 n=1 Tax=Dysidea avara TaxID=196820 RepID=UPI00332B6976
MVPIISHRRFATSDKMAASSGGECNRDLNGQTLNTGNYRFVSAHICDTDRLQDGIVISSRVVAPRNLPAIRSIATTREEEVVQRNDNVEDAVTITATQSGGVVMQPGGVLRQSGVLPEGSGAACIQLPGSHTSCNAASFFSFNPFAVHRECQMDAATLPGGVVMQPGGVIRQSGALPGIQQAGLRLNNYKHHSEGSGAACIQLPGSHTSCNAASFPSFNSIAVHREGQMDAATLPGGVVMQPGGVIRQSGALPEGSGAACIQLPGSHTSCNAASFPSFNSIAVHREGQMDAATLPGGVVMQPGGVLRQSGVLPEGSGAACVQLPGSHTSCNAASFPAFNPFLVRTALREGQTVLGSGATVQSSCIPTSCSIVSVAGDLPLKVMEGHSEISRDDVIEPERITATQSSSSLTSYISQGESHYEDLCFIPRKCSDSASSRPILEVIQKTTFDVPPAGHISVARVLLYRMEASYKYETQVLFTTINNGTISTAKEFLDACGVISEKNGYKFCPGLNVQHYHEYFFAVIRYHLESCRLWEHPFKRVDSKNCSLWHKLPVQAPLKDRSKSAVLCRGCKRLNTNLEHQRKRSDVSPAKRAKRLLPSSSFKLKYLSPKSVAKRKQATQRERSRDKVAIAEANNEVVLEDDQSDEVNQIMQTIESEAATELDEVLKEMPTGRSIWNDDKRNPKAEFFKDQRLNRNGKKQNQWSTITIRIALAVFVRSPAAYEALKSFNILQLPSRSTLQAYTGAFLHEAGAAAESIAKQVEMYAASVAKCKKEGKLTPQSDGTLIFDEVKVVSGLIWNSRSQRIIGLAMTERDQASLQDVFQSLSPDQHVQQTTHMLQFLWRDLTSGFDIVGPYYSCSESMSSKFVLACILETIQLFQVYDLRTSLLICDGSSANLAALKASHGHFTGAYNNDHSGLDPFVIKPYFINQYDPPNKIHWLICPSHQLKNMINALFSSQSGGTKGFRYTIDGQQFGWKAITDLYARECQRRESGVARQVPKLREAFVLRDSWTKLNVLPAKIMQQELVLSELYKYCKQDPAPSDSVSVELCLKYLEACNKLFENGYLSHKKIVSLQSPVLKSIEDGYSYFTTWHKNLSTKGPMKLQDPRFLSWQTWDLLRVCIYGFKSFAANFLEKYPDHFISPVRLSGSAVETLFSQFKHTAGGKLSATNYANTRAAHLIKHCVTAHHSSVGYRDATLQLSECTLEKKQYNKKSK